MRDGREILILSGRQLTHAHFPLCQQDDQPHARHIPQGLHQARRLFQGNRVHTRRALRAPAMILAINSGNRKAS